MSNLEIFKEIAMGQLPRVLGLGDRSENSDTFGCFDRYYWHYSLKDFPNARCQEAALLLALVYTHAFDGKAFYHAEKVKRWITGAITYWTRMQNADGSFNEYYPYERSFVATAFTAYAVSEALIALGDDGLIATVRPHIVKAGVWLSRHNNRDVGNQMAGAIAALYNIHCLADREGFLDGARKKIQLLTTMQAPEGYFLEYDGCDIGYLTIAISYLAKYHRASGDREILPVIEKAVRCAERTILPDGTYDWRTTSRKTQYIYPHGFKLMGNTAVIERLTHGLKLNAVVNPAWMDDMFCLPLAIDYLQTYLSK